MSSLGDRLSAARKATDDDLPFDADEQLDAPAEQPVSDPDATPTYSAKHAGNSGPTPPKPESPAPSPGGGRRALPVSAQDRMEELKQTVHAELLKQLGPKLYGGEMSPEDLDKQVRIVLTDVLARQDRPISNSDRIQITQEISEIVGGADALVSAGSEDR